MMKINEINFASITAPKNNIQNTSTAKHCTTEKVKILEQKIINLFIICNFSSFAGSQGSQNQFQLTLGEGWVHPGQVTR